MRHEIRYGKADVSFYRTRARPLRDVPAIPESSFTGRENTLFAATVTVDVFGDNFLPAYTEGDNSQVVATDTMKNFVHARALEYEGSTHEGFAAFLARGFLETYPQMRRVRVSARESPFAAHGERLLSPLAGDHGTVLLEADREGLKDLRCGRGGLRLLKLTGSSFASFVRDRYTTLPERTDRPLYIHLEVAWRYLDPAAAVADPPSSLVPSEQVADLVRHTFDGFVSRSIQHLVHEMGQRLLARFPALLEVSFEAQNRLWDTVAQGDGDEAPKVYSDPRPAHGLIGLTLRRD